MGLIKYKLGKLLDQSNIRNKNVDNKYFAEDVRGISTGKEFIETKANLKNVSLRPYKIVDPENFAYVADTSRRGDKISLAFNDSEKTIIVSSISTVFNVRRKDLLDPYYLFMYFNRSEFDRFSRYNSWGSARETFSWEDFCDIEIELPPLVVQKKYVAVYKSLLENQESYEEGLEDITIIANAYFDKLKKDKSIIQPLGNFIEKNMVQNDENLFNKKYVRGISNQKEFMPTKARLTNKDLSKFIIIKPNYFAYNSRTDGRDMLVLALNREPKSVMVTNNYDSFKVKDTFKEVLNTEYLYSYLKRKEFDRRVRFMSWGSSQELFSWESLCEIKIPLPDIKIQNAIADIYTVYTERKEINEKLRVRLKNICPILIKGAMEEASREEV